MKGMDILLESWKIMGEKAPELLICGTGPMEDWCKDYIEKNHLMSVKMMGFVHNVEAKKLISNSKALILPTQWYEGFPMTIVEAYSVGTPVIGADFGNVGSVIIDGTTGLKCHAQAAISLAQTVSEFVRGNNNMVLSTKKEFEDKYTQKENYKKIIKIYNDVGVKRYFAPN